MAESSLNGTIEVVRGQLTDARAEQLLRFWEAHTDLDESESRRRLAEVLCVLVTADGEITAVNSAFSAPVPLIAGCTLWIYRTLALPEATDAAPAMFRAAYNALEEEFVARGEGPIGLCALVADPAAIRRYPQARWDDPPTIYAGYLADGRQVRVAYFYGATIHGKHQLRNIEWPLAPGYDVPVFDRQDAFDAQAVVDFWVAEGVIAADEAARRVHEVLLLGTGPEGQLVGVCTVYLQRNAQLGMDLWHLRTFVAREHRISGLAAAFAQGAREELERRFTSGADVRGAGVLYEVENEGLKEHFPQAHWPGPTQSMFVGTNARGDHVRVHYFAGALAPDPPR